MADIWGIDQPTVLPLGDKLLNPADPLTISTPDEELLKHVNDRIKQSTEWYTTQRNLYKRQDRNFAALMGRDEDDKTWKRWQSRYKDNAIWEAESSIKPIALSRLPDLTVSPGTDNPDSIDVAKNVGKIIDSDIKKRENREVLAVAALKHHPVYFIGCIKPRWDKNVGKDGDYVFEVVHPKRLVIDHTAITKDMSKADFVAESIPISVKELLALFPNKKKEIYEEIHLAENDPAESKKLATKWNIWEVWFKWYEKEMDRDTNEATYRPIECVLWKYKNILFKKMKNPYWDWEGQSRIEQNGTPVDITKLSGLLEQKVNGAAPMYDTSKVYRNYFDNPRKPYILIGYEQWGEMPYDETSRIEQVVELQKDTDKRGRQITEMADRARGKHVFSSASGIKKEDIQNLDVSNPDADLLIKGEDVNKVHSFVPGEQPSQALFNDKEMNKNAIFNKMGVHDTTRGIQTPGKPGISDQIAREADYGRIDDLTEEIINAPAEQMAQWAMHFIKMFYSEDHFRKILGESGTVTFKKINSDMIEDGMEVVVSASGTDKVLRQRRAMDMAQIKMTDPLSFFEDLGISSPRERAEKLLMFTTDPAGYMAKYVMGLENGAQMAGALDQPSVGGQVPQLLQSPEGQGVPINNQVIPQSAVQGGVVQ